MKKNTIQIILIILIILAILVGFWFLLKSNTDETSQLNDPTLPVNNNELPDNQADLDDRQGVDENNNNDNDDDLITIRDEEIKVSSPQKNEIVSSPITVEGEATGPWYFEASFSLKLIDDNTGEVISESYVTSLEEWMTEDLVPFSGEIEFSVDKETEAKLLFESANPSGLPKNLKTYSIPVTLMPKSS